MTDKTINQLSENWGEALTYKVGANILSYREFLGWSAQDLSDQTAKTGVAIARSNIAKLETQKKKSITYQELLALSSAFGLPAELLRADIFNPSEEYRETPNFPPIPGYLLARQTRNNFSNLRKKTDLTYIWSTLSIYSMVLTQAFAPVYYSKVVFPKYITKGKRLNLTEFTEYLEKYIAQNSDIEDSMWEEISELEQRLRENSVKLWDLQKTHFFIDTISPALQRAMSRELSEDNMGEDQLFESLNIQRYERNLFIANAADIPDLSIPNTIGDR